jgi:hypothetical protein
MSDTAAIPELPRASEAAAKLEGKSPADPIAPSEDPKERLDYTFQFKYKDPRGKQWLGEFTNKILTIRMRQRQKVLKAQLSGNTPVAALDADAWTLNEMIAHMTISLSKRPDWAKELTDLVDEVLVEQLYEEVASHEATFHGRGPDTDSSSKSTEDGAGAA